MFSLIVKLKESQHKELSVAKQELKAAARKVRKLQDSIDDYTLGVLAGTISSFDGETVSSYVIKELTDDGYAVVSVETLADKNSK